MSNAVEGSGDARHDQLEPLPGEQGIPSVHQATAAGVSAKMIVAVVVMVASLVFAGYALLGGNKDNQAKAEKAAESKGPKAAAATTTASKKFDPSKLPEGAPAVPSPAVTPVPGIEPESNQADPIGVRSTRSTASSSPSKASPLDSSANLALVTNTEGNEPRESTTPQDERVTEAKERLSELQDTMKGLVTNLTNVTRAPAATTAPATKPATPALGGQLVASGTARISATMLGNRSLTLPKGTTFNCALKTRIVSEQSGFVSCQVLRNVYSDNGRVLLIERGSHLDGEYTAKYRTGQTRIFMVWSRVRTSEGVTVDIESPATGPLGESGVDGYVDNHWAERFGGAMLVTLIDDAVKITVAKQASAASTVVAQDTGDTASKVAEKMLDASVNIPPTIYKNQGEVVGIFVSKDVDFSSVYELRTVAR